MQSQSFFKRWSQPVLVAGVSALLVTTSALADDTEVFQAQIKSSAPPNLLFVLDYSGSMTDPIVAGSAGARKIDILKDAVRAVIKDNAGKINSGIGSLYSGTPSGVQWPISDLNADPNTIDPNIPAGSTTVEQIISDQLDSRAAIGGTATVDALAEAAAYFRGDPVFHNGQPASNISAHIPDIYDSVIGQYINGGPDAAIAASYMPTNAYLPSGGNGSATALCQDYTLAGTYPGEANSCLGQSTSNCVTLMRPTNSGIQDYFQCDYPRTDQWIGADYASPINAECGINAIVLVSDGEPRVRENAEQLNSILGHDDTECADLTELFIGSDKQAEAAATGKCGPELAAQLASNPQMPGIKDSYVRTYTVGFPTQGPGQDYLKEIAEQGNGRSYVASSPEALATALGEIADSLITTSQSFAPLAVDVDRANFSHDNRLYYSMFKPSRTASWGGNLKGYFFGDNELVDINDQVATELNQDGVRVMRAEAQSFWSRSADGDDVIEGGTSALLTKGGRTLLTNVGGLDEGRSLTNLDASNNDITAEMLNATGDRDELLNWLQTAPMGDPLHSQPVQVNYGDERLIYVMTNQGFLHAFNATTPVAPSATNADNSGGEEQFAFMPKEMLRNLPIHKSQASTDQRTYGLDGALVRWHDDKDMNGIVDGNDTVMLVFGMRRGGSHYYALDVTNRNAPKLVWQIDGGSAEFPRLGETWSRPSLVNVMNNGDETEVLAFGGGYNAAQLDGTKNKKRVNSGNAIYMIDRNGKKVWSVDGNSVTGMDYAIPSDLSIVDVDGDDVMDRIYVGDLGGNIWRVDIGDIARTNETSAAVLAELNQNGIDQTFFYPPSVALNTSVYGDFISVSIGSGNRTNPLRLDSNGRLFMIRDRYVKDPLPNNFKDISVSDLHDATLNPIDNENVTTAERARDELNASDGWYIRLDDNEKVLSQLVTFEGKLLGTTFDVDEAELADPCQTPGQNRFYLMDVATAQPARASNDKDQTSSLSQADRSQDISGDGILPQPSIMFPPGGDEVVIIVDNEVVSTITQGFSRIFWHNR